MRPSPAEPVSAWPFNEKSPRWQEVDARGKDSAPLWFGSALRGAGNNGGKCSWRGAGRPAVSRRALQRPRLGCGRPWSAGLGSGWASAPAAHLGTRRPAGSLEAGTGSRWLRRACWCAWEPPVPRLPVWGRGESRGGAGIPRPGDPPHVQTPSASPESWEGG